MSKEVSKYEDKQQTAVEWYEKEINSLFQKYELKEISQRDFIIMKHNLFYPAKEIEKQQIIDAFDIACEDENRIGKEYYNETFKKKEPKK